jgi:type I restriction enzyme S subunit
MVNKNKNPEIRFKGFTEDWEEQLLSNICNIVGGGTPSTMIPEYWGGDIDWYSPTEIGKEIYALGSIKKITKLGFENCSAKILPPEKTILFTSRAGIGDMAILKKEGTTNQGFQSFILNNDINTYFIYSARPLIKKFSLKNASGSTFLEISGKTLEKMVIHLPKTTEQKQIGIFFQNLDNLITLHQKKYDKLVILKKAMMEKMFPKNGALVPEIRFKGFSGDWEKDSLGNIYNFQYGIFNINPSNGGEFPVYGANGIIGGYTEYNAENSIIIGHMGEYAGIVLWDKGKHFVTYNGIITKPKNEKILLKFGYFMLFKLNLRKICGGSGQPFLSYSTLNNISSMFPKSNEEQEKIGSYFESLDNQIDLHKTQIEKLNNIKKACFSKMFVAQD